MFLYAKNLIDKAIKFPLALLENLKPASVEEAGVPVDFQKVFYVLLYVGECVGLCSQ